MKAASNTLAIKLRNFMVILIFKRLKALTKVRNIKNVCSVSPILLVCIRLNLNYANQSNQLIKEFFLQNFDELASSH